MPVDERTGGYLFTDAEDRPEPDQGWHAYCCDIERLHLLAQGRVADLEAEVAHLKFIIDSLTAYTTASAPAAWGPLAEKGQQARCPCGEPMGGPPCTAANPCSYAEGMDANRWGDSR